MTDHTHQTAPTQFVDGAGIRFAYRRFGKNQGVPLVFFQHFTGTMDNWDPAMTNGLARDREGILFNNAGISVRALGPKPPVIGSGERLEVLEGGAGIHPGIRCKKRQPSGPKFW